MKSPKDLEEAREVGLEVDLEEEEMEAEGRGYVTNSMKRVIFPETDLTQDDHGDRTMGTMAMQLKTSWN